MRDLTQVAEKIDQLNIFFRRGSNVLTAYIFGSFGTDVQSPLSDLDLAVLYDSGPVIG
ncbi:MAG: nucleotidyltransferase domain-containing protein [Bacillota bacterium]